jgi:hypothetical protein
MKGLRNTILAGMVTLPLIIAGCSSKAETTGVDAGEGTEVWDETPQEVVNSNFVPATVIREAGTMHNVIELCGTYGGEGSSAKTYYLAFEALQETYYAKIFSSSGDDMGREALALRMEEGTNFEVKGKALKTGFRDNIGSMSTYDIRFPETPRE